MNIITYGTDPRLSFCCELLLECACPYDRNIVLLPIPTTRDGVGICGTELTFDAIYPNLNSGDMVVGYELPRSVREALSQRGILIADLGRDEEFLSPNAALTSDGTVGRILTESRRAPSDLKIGIIGYGRIGERLLNLLAFLGASVVVFTSKKEVREELGMLSVQCMDTGSFDSEDGLAVLSSLDILINTAPVPLIPDSVCQVLRDKRVIELASGSNIPDGISYERFPSVPARMYPASAGYVLGRAVIRMLGTMDEKCI